MGQKVHPKGFRIGIIKDWDAKWFAEKDFAKLLLEDYKVRKFVKAKLYASGVSRIEIERAANRVKVNIFTAKPGIVIGRGGTEVENLKRQLEAMTGKKVNININEIKKPELDAQLVAENVAAGLEKRIAFRRAMKQAVSPDHASRCRRHQDHVSRPVSRSRNCPYRVVCRRQSAFAHPQSRH